MYSIRLAAVLVAGALSLGFVAPGCRGAADDGAKGDQASGGEAPRAALPADLPEGTIHGKVTETMDSGGYTYVLVDTGEGAIWAAGPQSEVTVGDEVTLPPGSPMPGFKSETLDRTFDVIYFVSAINVAGAQGAGAVSGTMPPGHPAIGGGGEEHAKAVAPPQIDFTGIAKAEGGVTVADIFAGSADLTGKPIAVRGKVVKFTPNIMGTNWIHIQDGTGEPGSNDLTVTSKALVKVGDTILVRGNLTVNRDFGGGYRYAVIIENGDVAVE